MLPIDPRTIRNGPVLSASYAEPSTNRSILLWASALVRRPDPRRAAVPITHLPRHSLRLQNTRKESRRHRPRRTPSVLMALMNQVLDLKITKFAFFPQFANRIDGIADRALAGWLNSPRSYQFFDNV